MKNIETKRLILRNFGSSDKDDLFEIFSDRQTVAFEPYLPADEKSIEVFLNERVGNDAFYAMQCKDGGKVIGNVYLEKNDENIMELGYVIGRKFWKKGFGSEACKAVIENAFENGIQHICAKCDPKNENSVKLLHRLGFIRKARLRNDISFFDDENGKPIMKDTFVYVLQKDGKAQNRIVDEDIRLLPYYPDTESTFPWYQDAQSCLQADRIGKPYTVSRINAMYSYLDKNGECFYIEYKGILCGDITLKNDGEICIFIAKEYQNLHIGRKCVLHIIQLAKQKGLREVRANIYDFNKQSRAMFESLGFAPDKKEWYRKECV